METKKRGRGRPKKNNEEPKFVTSRLDVVSLKMATISSKVLLFRQKTRGESKDEQLVNPFVVWFSPRKNTFQAHIMGNLCTGKDMIDVLEKCERYLLNAYNKHFKTKHNSIIDCDFEDNAQQWSKEKLLLEYSKLRLKVQKLERKFVPDNVSQDTSIKRSEEEVDRVFLTQCIECGKHIPVAKSRKRLYCGNTCNKRYLYKKAKRANAHQENDNLIREYKESIDNENDQITHDTL